MRACFAALGCEDEIWTLDHMADNLNTETQKVVRGTLD